MFIGILKERERNIDGLPSVGAPARDETCNLGMYTDRESNSHPFGAEEDALASRAPSQGRRCSFSGTPVHPLTLNPSMYFLFSSSPT